MSKREIGEVARVNKGGGTAEYLVRLAHGEMVIVPHSLIRPARMTLLPKGSRILVTHQLGQVESATTDLTYTVTGVVGQPSKALQEAAYVIDLSQGGSVRLEKAQIQGHPPARSLIPGAVLEMMFENGSVSGARLVREHDRAVVQRIDPLKKTVTVRADHGDSFTIRLDAAALRQILTGERLEIEIEYSPEGKRKIALQRPAGRETGPRPSPAPSEKPPASQPAPKRKSPGRAQAQPDSLGLNSMVVAEAIGLDPVELARVKHAGHRFEIVSFLEKHARDDLIEWYRLKGGRPERFAQPEVPLQALIQRAVRSALPEFRGFYQHQARALDSIRRDRSLVIVTQTASGKTLSYNPAVFEYLASNPNGHVLYVFPLNALMMDQVEKVNDLVAALQKEKVRVTAAHLKGGMAPAEREAVARSCPNIIATNPEMLTFMLGAANGAWRPFFAGLKYVVVDEVHSYRGLLGVHMTGILRRLLLACRGLGSDLRFILSSATVSNPLDLASRLTSLPETDFDLVGPEEDGSRQADKHWLVLNSDWGARGTRFGNYQEVAAEVFVEMLLAKNADGNPSPLNTILFCRSIREVKSIGRLVNQRLEQRAPQLKYKVKSYVSAELSIEVKREIYEGLRSGRFLGVISTNALEAGIDIGRLDACIIAGFPYSVMAMRQMAGRVGRVDEGIVMFIPFPLSSLDQYYRDHPDLLLEQPPEVFVVDPHNPYIARKHINAAALLKGISETDLRRYWGEQGLEIARQALQDGVMRFRNGTWSGTRRNYQDADDVYAVNNIRSNIQRPYAVCLENGQACQAGAQCFTQSGQNCPNRITLLDQQYVYRDCHPGAVYESTDRRLFRVTRLDDAARVAWVQELPEESLERTFVEADIEIELNGEPRAHKTIANGVELAWGDATVTRLFTGYYRYSLQPARRCRSCRKEYEDQTLVCPICRRSTELFYTRSKAERQDFPPPSNQGFRIVLKTVACWLAVTPNLESGLESCSPCRLPGDQNRVQVWLKQPLKWDRLPDRLRLSEAEKDGIARYHAAASQQVAQARLAQADTLLFPGVYGQCLLAELRKLAPESRALELYQFLTGYPVTDDLRHICRQCQRSVLLPAMHTLEHAVSARYPSVALGDRSDIGAFTTLGHAATGSPAIFWFDNYEGGLGAAEKVYEFFTRLLASGLEAMRSCTCTTLEGCPRCTYIPDCAEGNADLSKPAGILLISRLLNQAEFPGLHPFIYRKKRAAEFAQRYKENETAPFAHGWGEEAPPPVQLDPYQLLRIQRQVHEVVATKAFEARSREILDETPPVSASQLNEAYQSVIRSRLLKDWQIRLDATPYEILEILPAANLKMTQQIYRVIAMQVHPDSNPGRAAWANEMMKQVNAAYDQVIKEKSDPWKRDR